MSGTPEASFLAVITAWIAAAVAAVMGWIWMHTMGRIKALEQGKVDLHEYEKNALVAERSGHEMRDSIREVSNKLDAFKDDVGRKFDELKDLLLKPPGQRK